MKTQNFFIKMFTAHSGLSSKRVCGFIGWVVCLFICIWCTVYGTQAPDISDWLFICSTSLLGLDSVTGMIGKRKGLPDLGPNKDIKFNEIDKPIK